MKSAAFSFWGQESQWVGAMEPALGGFVHAWVHPPPLPFIFPRRLQSPQCNQQLLGGNKGLDRGRCGEREVDDLGAEGRRGEGQSDAEKQVP